MYVMAWTYTCIFPLSGQKSLRQRLTERVITGLFYVFLRFSQSPKYPKP